MEDQDAPLKVTINGQEYDATEAQALIETGQKTRDYEKQWNTPLDNVWTGYGKSREEIKSVAAERDEMRAKLAEYEAKKASDTETPTDTREAQEAARKLGLTLNDDLAKAGYIKRDELDKYFDEKEQSRKAVESVLQKADELASKIDGSDGRPKFNKRAVMAYASAYGKSSLEEAYEEMHEDQLTPWKEQQVKSKEAKNLKTLKPGGAKEVTQPRVNKDNFGQALSEALSGTE